MRLDLSFASTGKERTNHYRQLTRASGLPVEAFVQHHAHIMDPLPWNVDSATCSFLSILVSETIKTGMS